MPPIVITGAPGAGKTTLLAELGMRGFKTVAEAARAIIADRLARGETPRPDPVTFAREIVRRDIESYVAHSSATNWVFFDRSVLEGIGMLKEAGAIDDHEIAQLLSTYRFHPTVFVLPPWEAIYSSDSERDQSFSESLAVHLRIVSWYTACGYQLEEVPRGSVAARADYVLGILARDTSGCQR